MIAEFSKKLKDTDEVDDLFYFLLLDLFFKIDLKIKEHPRNLIPELLRLFYGLDWVTGTGGGISIKLEFYDFNTLI